MRVNNIFRYFFSLSPFLEDEIYIIFFGSLLVDFLLCNHIVLFHPLVRRKTMDEEFVEQRIRRSEKKTEQKQEGFFFIVNLEINV